MLFIKISIKVSDVRALASCNYLWSSTENYYILKFLMDKYHKYLALLITTCATRHTPNRKKESFE